MAKIKYDVSNVEDTGGADQPKPGIYTCKVDSVEEKESKAGNDMLEVILRVTEGEFKGAPLWTYIILGDEAMAWRMKQFTDALGIRSKGTLDTDKILGEKVRVRVKADSYEGEYKARVGRILPLDDAASEEDDEDEPEPDEPDDADGVDLDELDRRELKAYIKENSLEIRVLKSMSDDDIREAIVEAEAGAEEPEDEDDGPYDDHDITALKDELRKRKLKTSGKKSDLISRLVEDDESEDDEDDDEPF